MQEDIENRSVVLTTRATQMSARALAMLMRSALRKIKQGRDAPVEGKQSVKELAKGGSLQSIEITDGNIKAFEPFARKYGVSYALQRDNSVDPPKWLVFFRAKDTDALTAAFRAFTAKVLNKAKERPSTLAAMARLGELIKNAVRDRVKNKDHGERDR